MPTVSPELQLPAFLASTPLRLLGWIATLCVLAAVARVVMRPRVGASSSDVALAFARHGVRLALFVVGVVVTAVALQWLGAREGVVGDVAGALTVVLLTAVAVAAGLFFARQLLAPPWWRLNAWDPGSAVGRGSFGIGAAARWILDDIRELVGGLRLVERALVLVAIPLALVNAMATFGVERTLGVTYGALFVLYVSLVVALFSANRIPRVLMTRLQDLRQVARRIAGGDLSARVGYLDTAEYEELGELVADVNTMARALQSREHENAALTQQLNNALQFEQERASRDHLTQLHNHRYFQEALAAELYRCSRTGEMTTVAILDLDDFKAVNDTYGHQEGDAVLQRMAQAFAQTLRPYDLPARLGGEEFGVIFPSTTPEEAKVVMDRIMEALSTAGPNGSVQTFSGGIATFPIHAQDQSMLLQLADSSSYAAKMNGKKHTVIFDRRVSNVAEDDRVNTRERDAQLKAARILVQSADAIEGLGGSGSHSENVGQASSAIATSMGFDEGFAKQMYLCGLLHDVGKLGIDQAIVQKSGGLTQDEFEAIKRHPDLSAQIVANAGLGDIATWVRHHHEHFDGTGYPLGLQGHDIPIGSRIVLAAEAFDVMTSDRSYRHAMSVSDALGELVAGSGTRFDPEVVTHLVHLVQNGVVTPGGGAAPAADGWNRAA